MKGGQWCLGVGKLAPDVGDNSPELGVSILKEDNVFLSDLATELQLFFPSPFNLPVQDNQEKQDHSMDFFLTFSG